MAAHRADHEERTKRLNEIRDQLMKAAEELPGVDSTRVIEAAAGVFRIGFADGTGATVDIWHSDRP